MDRLQIYATRTLVAVEFAVQPSSLAALGGRAHVFRRLDLAATRALHRAAVAAADATSAAQMNHLMAVLAERVAYWEKRVPPALDCWVHHVRFADEAQGRAGHARAVADFPRLAMSGLYAIDPVISFFPQAFPVDPAPNFWRLGRANSCGPDSLFFLNFFPAQPFLREQVVQGTTAIYSESAPGLYHANNYVDLVDDLFAATGSVDRVVSVNLNRYSDGAGFFRAVAGGAARSVITEGAHADFRWHGMLCRLVGAG
jgi:hypothetical protein